MSEFVKYIRNFLGFGISEEKNNIRNRKRRLVQEEFENYSVKLRRLNDYKMNNHSTDDWCEIPASLKSNYLRHFPNRLQMVEERRPMSRYPGITETIDLSDDDDVVDITPKCYGAKRNNVNGHGSSSSSAHSWRPRAPTNVVSVARQTINNCSRFLNRRTSNSSDTIRLDEQELYRDMLQNSPRTSAAYTSSTPHRGFDFQENARTKKILSLLKEKSTVAMIDLTDDKITEKSSKANDSVMAIKDSDSESSSTNRTTPRKVSPVNSMRKMLDNEPFMDPNYIKKMDDDHATKRNEMKRQIIEEGLKREKFSKLNRENVNLILESLVKKCKITEAIILEDVEEALTFPQFSTEQEAQINGALKCRHPSRVFNEKFNLRITGGDLKLLNEKEWLNDELINFYVNMIQERSQHQQKLPKVYAFSTFFYPKLVSNGYSSLRRWTKRVDIFSYDIIVVPVHLGFHWCMAIIDFRDKSIRYYDSMLGVNMQCLTSLEKYLQEEYRDKKKADYDTSGWQKCIMKDIPRQMNGSDCGVFSCTFAEFITRNAKILFTQEHMPYIRRKMVIEIIQGRLLT